jgi:2-polyprenyl-3-methyl-5-hydroxy-6-metoxy-1,4-benzoquinol methylase
VSVAETSYNTKPDSYFRGIVRRDYISELPKNSAGKILEIGCGDGSTGEHALAEGKCGTYCGIEIVFEAAEKAMCRLSEVLAGDIETLSLPWRDHTFDVLILSEVLEHLIDPWHTLQRLRPLLKPGALVFASSPNVSNHKIIRMLLKGEWNLADSGIMDRTHLRWFTPKTYRAMFHDCGYSVTSVSHLGMSRKGKLLSALTLGSIDHLLIGQIDLRARIPLG